jgi:beta-glucosidase
LFLPPHPPSLPTLYHSDLPQALSDRGGWTQRDTALRFSDHAGIMAKALGDRIPSWLIFNEPWNFTLFGYLTGGNPPGITDWPTYLRTTHIVNIAQGQAFRALRAARFGLKISTAFSMAPYEPRSTSAVDQDAAERLHAYVSLWFLAPAISGQYPDVFRPLPQGLMAIRSGDMELIRAPFDFIGMDTYLRGIAWAESPGLLPGLEATLGAGSTGPVTDMGWEVWPACIHDMRGTHAPGWTNGFSQRFGLVYVDFASEQRTVKNSGAWYAQVAAKNQLAD